MFKLMNTSFMMNNSINMMNMNKMNDKMMIMMLMIMTIICMMIIFYYNNLINKSMYENQNMEFMWTMMPMMLISLMSFMSINVLYMNNEMKISSMSIKIIGNQWFWNYNYMNFNLNFNSYMMMKNKFNFNILETDNKIIIPINMQIMMIVSSMDVIHSWTIPSINIKIDAIPNQINNMMIMTNKINLMFGQCSEICGINHSFMPIMMESVSMNNFIKWIKMM